MSVTNFSDLQTEAIAYSGRGDLIARLPTFIQLAEADMQIRLKLVDLETTATVTVTSGSGSLPTDFAGFRSAYWDGDEKRPLTYITPDRFNALDEVVQLPTYFTVQGTTLKVLSEGDGSVVIDYQARFTALSATDTTNAIITKYPDAYFFGTLAQLYAYTRNDKEQAKWQGMYEAAIQRIIKDHKDRKYPGPLEVRAR
jgi:hypothetical protein